MATGSADAIVMIVIADENRSAEIAARWLDEAAHQFKVCH